MEGVDLDPTIVFLSAKTTTLKDQQHQNAPSHALVSKISIVQEVERIQLKLK